MKHNYLSLVVLAAAACAPEGGSEWTGSVDTLTSGTVVIRNPTAGMWDSATAWRLREELRIGRVEGGGPDEFGQIIALEVDASGRIYVLERQAQEIRVFGPDGAYIRTIGREGRGPGELAGANGLSIDPHGRLWVVDGRNARYSVFDAEGTYLTSYRREAGGFSYAWLGGMDRDGRLWDAWTLRDPDPRRALFRFDTAGAYPDTLRLPLFAPDYYEVERSAGGSRGIIQFRIPFAATEQYRLDPRGYVWWNRSDEYRILQLSLRGDTIRVIERAYEPLPVTDADRERAIAPLRAADPTMEFDASRIPDRQPALLGFVVDDRDHLWTVPTGSDLGFDVFTPDGRYLGHVRSGLTSWRLAPAPVIRGDAMYYVTSDDMDVPYVVRARIEGRAP